MKMERRIGIGLMCLVVVLVAARVEATQVGYQTDFFDWERGDVGTGFAVWDTFTTTQFFNQAGDSSGGTLATGFLTQSQPTVSPAGIFGGGDRVYIHTDFTLWGIDLTSSAATQSVVLQIKEFTNNTLEGVLNPVLNDNQNSLNGIAFSGTTTALVNESTTNYIHKFVWENLTPTSDLQLSFNAGPFAFSSIDGTAVDFSNNPSAVPEPSSALLLLLGLASAVCSRRKR